jgi:hypothetical protein
MSGVTTKVLIPLLPRRASGVSVRDEDGQTVVRPGGDPRLGAVEHPVVAVAHGLAAQRGRVAAGVGLREGEGAEQLAARHQLEVALLQRLAPVAQEHLRGQRVVHAHQHRRARVGRRDLLERQQVARRVEPQAVVLLGEQHAEEAELPHLPDEGGLEVLIAVPLGREGRDVLAREVARQALDLALRLGQRQQGVEHVHAPYE